MLSNYKNQGFAIFLFNPIFAHQVKNLKFFSGCSVARSSLFIFFILLITKQNNSSYCFGSRRSQRFESCHPDSFDFVEKNYRSFITKSSYVQIPKIEIIKLSKVSIYK